MEPSPDGQPSAPSAVKLPAAGPPVSAHSTSSAALHAPSPIVARPSLLDAPISFEQLLADASPALASRPPADGRPLATGRTAGSVVSTVRSTGAATPSGCSSDPTASSGGLVDLDRSESPASGASSSGSARLDEALRSLVSPQVSPSALQTSFAASLPAAVPIAPVARPSAPLLRAAPAVPAPPPPPPMLKPLPEAIKLVVHSKPVVSERAASVLPVRDVIYDLSSDDDDMIACEPDPDDVKPAPLAPATAKAVKVKIEKGQKVTDKQRKSKAKKPTTPANGGKTASSGGGDRQRRTRSSTFTTAPSVASSGALSSAQDVGPSPAADRITLTSINARLPSPPPVVRTTRSAATNLGSEPLPPVAAISRPVAPATASVPAKRSAPSATSSDDERPLARRKEARLLPIKTAGKLLNEVRSFAQMESNLGRLASQRRVAKDEVGAEARVDGQVGANTSTVASAMGNDVLPALGSPLESTPGTTLSPSGLAPPAIKPTILSKPQPTEDGEIIKQTYNGQVLTFKKATDGFFSCLICHNYAKPHSAPFKLHVARCAEEHERPSSDSSSASESDDFSPRAQPVVRKGKARQVVSSDDDDDAFAQSDAPSEASNLGARSHKKNTRSRSIVPDEKPLPKDLKIPSSTTRKGKSSKPAAKNVEPAKPRREIPSSARPSARPVEFPRGDVKPLSAVGRTRPLADLNGPTKDVVQLDSNSDDGKDDDGSLVVLVKGSTVVVRPIGGQYTCPACGHYRCRNPDWIKSHVARCSKAAVAPREGMTAPDPSLSSSRRAHSPSVAPAPPQLVNKVKTRRSPVPSTLPKFNKKAAPLQFEDALRDVQRRQLDAPPPQAPSPPPAPTGVDVVGDNHPWPSNSWSPGQQLPPPTLLSAPALPFPSSSTPSGFTVNAPVYSGVPLAPPPDHWPQPDTSWQGMDYQPGPLSPSPPPRSPPADSPPSLQPGDILLTLHHLLNRHLPTPPPVESENTRLVAGLLELMRCWQEKLKVESSVGASSPATSTDEKSELRRIRASLEPLSAMEVHYSTSIDNVPRLWHLQYLLTHHCDRPSVIRDLNGQYFSLASRPFVAVSGNRVEQQHLADLHQTVRKLLNDVLKLSKHHHGTDMSQWLHAANISVARPVGLTLNHVSWDTLCDELTGWADRIVFAYDALSDMEVRSREAAEARLRSELEQRALLLVSEGPRS